MTIPELRFRLGLVALIFVASIAATATAPLPIQITATAWQAAAGNSGYALILVQLANSDGTPKLDAQMLAVDPRNPTAGLQLKGTKWAFDTMLVPTGFQGPGVEVLRPQTFFDPAVTRGAVLQGQVRLMQMVARFRPDVPNDPQAGLYAFSVLPEYGFTGGAKAVLKWIAGEYHFRMRYQDGPNQGTSFGMLVIR